MFENPHVQQSHGFEQGNCIENNICIRAETLEQTWRCLYMIVRQEEFIQSL